VRALGGPLRLAPRSACAAHAAAAARAGAGPRGRHRHWCVGAWSVGSPRWFPLVRTAPPPAPASRLRPRARRPAAHPAVGLPPRVQEQRGGGAAAQVALHLPRHRLHLPPPLPGPQVRRAGWPRLPHRGRRRRGAQRCAAAPRSCAWVPAPLPSNACRSRRRSVAHVQGTGTRLSLPPPPTPPPPCSPPLPDTYVEQLTDCARAAVEELQRRGVADPSRIAVGGHSYGAAAGRAAGRLRCQARSCWQRCVLGSTGCRRRRCHPHSPPPPLPPQAPS
jgi:hypothetical protein